MNDQELVIAYSADNPFEAKQVRQLFESNGIRCRITGDSLYNNTDVATALKPEILVVKTDFDDARTLVAKFESEKGDRKLSSEWECQNCNEQNPGDFDTCWKCQSDQQN